MSQQWWRDDDQLLAALGAALRSERSAPAGFIPIRKAAFSWRDIDVELATLTYDTVLEGTEAEWADVRSEPARLVVTTILVTRFSSQPERARW